MEVFGCDHAVEKYSYKASVWLYEKWSIYSERIGYADRVEYLKSVANMWTLGVDRLSCQPVCGQLVVRDRSVTQAGMISLCEEVGPLFLR